MRKQAVLLVALIVLTWALPSAAQEAAAQARQTLEALEHDWARAIVDGDLEALGRIYGDDLVYTHSSGSVESKAEYIESLRSGSVDYQAVHLDGLDVRVYGDAALVFGLMHAKVLARGQQLDNRLRYIHVYVKRPAGWQMVAHQTTRLPQE